MSYAPWYMEPEDDAYDPEMIEKARWIEAEREYNNEPPGEEEHEH